MIHVKTLAPDDDPQVAQVNEEMKEMFDGLDRFTKELLAAYVSKLNTCAY
jgi:hypothetical protein